MSVSFYPVGTPRLLERGVVNQNFVLFGRGGVLNPTPSNGVYFFSAFLASIISASGAHESGPLTSTTS